MKRLFLTLLLGVFSLCGFVHCDGESSGGEDESAGIEDDTSEKGSSVGDEVEEETEADADLKDKCDVSNRTKLCCNGTVVQVCTEELKWSECECDKDLEDDNSLLADLIEEEEETNTTPEGNLLSEISFEWDESLFDYAECTPGKYTGSWKCSRQGLTFQGPVTMTLMESANGEFLEISDGELTGKAINGIVNFTSALAGGLDRLKNEFTAEAVDGKYTSRMMPNGTFKGTLTGECVDGEISISGEWSLTDGMTNVPCKGPWLIELVNETTSP